MRKTAGWMAGFAALTLRAVAAEAGGAIETAEFVNDPLPTPACHASTVADGGSGLVAAWFGGTDEGNADVGIWLARRTGDAWQPARQVADGKQPDGTRFPCWNPVLFRLKSGALLLFFKVGPTCDRWWGMLATSADGGATWSASRRLPNGMIGPVKNKPVELADGRLLCGSSDELGGWRVHMEWTADGGATWARTGPLHDGRTIGAIQPCFLLHGARGVQAIGRTRQGRVFSLSSEDGGTTWSGMTLLDRPNPNSGLDALTLADGRHLLVYNPVAKGRSPLAIALSDDGRTWKDVLKLEDEPGREFSYPAVIQTSDGKVHVTYTWKRLKVRHVVLDPAKLGT